MTVTVSAKRSAPAFLAVVIALLLTAGCSLGIGPDRVEEFPMIIRGVVWSSNIERGEAIGGQWSGSAELRLSPRDAALLGLSERTGLNLSNPESSPKLTMDRDTIWLVNDVGTSPEYCFEGNVVLVDESQGSEYLIAEAGECFTTSLSFELHAEIVIDN